LPRNAFAPRNDRKKMTAKILFDSILHDSIFRGF
jgi:hypothetical protein